MDSLDVLAIRSWLFSVRTYGDVLVRNRGYYKLCQKKINAQDVNQKGRASALMDRAIANTAARGGL